MVPIRKLLIASMVLLIPGMIVFFVSNDHLDDIARDIGILAGGMAAFVGAIIFTIGGLAAFQRANRRLM